MSWYLQVWQRYAEFSGRSRRMEYWIFTLYNVVIFLVLYLAGVGFALVKQPEMGAFMYFAYVAYALAALVPSLACTVRRLHDTGKSGWWVLIALVPIVGAIALLVMMVLEGTPGNNQYGPDPKWNQRGAAIG